MYQLPFHKHPACHPSFSSQPLSYDTDTSKTSLSAIPEAKNNRKNIIFAYFFYKLRYNKHSF